MEHTMRLAVAASFVLVCANLYAAAPTATAKTPAPQNVNVRNLPLAGDGSVRVKCGQSGVTYDLLDGVLPLSPESEWISAWVPSAEFRKVTVVSDIGDYVSCLLEWRYLPNDVRTWDNGPRWGYAYGSENAASGEVVGPEFRARCSSSDYDAHVADVRVYLRN
jgi:hypothetical protein